MKRALLSNHSLFIKRCLSDQYYRGHWNKYILHYITFKAVVLKVAVSSSHLPLKMSIEVFQPCLFLSLPLSPDVETSGKEITTCFSVLVTDFRPLNTLLNPSSISLSLPPTPPFTVWWNNVCAQQMAKFNQIFIIKKPLCSGPLVYGRRYCNETGTDSYPSGGCGRRKNLKEKKKLQWWKLNWWVQGTVNKV